MKVFGYSISLNVLILIGILYLIMVVNALTSSCNTEGMSKKDKEKAKIGDMLKQIRQDISRAKKNGSLSAKQKRHYEEKLKYMRTRISDTRFHDMVDKVMRELNN